MKIIGITGSAYLVEMSVTEARHLTGDCALERDSYSAAHGPRSAMVGNNYDLHATLSSVQRVHGATEELKRSADSLRGLANVIERAAPQIPTEDTKR